MKLKYMKVLDKAEETLKQAVRDNQQIKIETEKISADLKQIEARIDRLGKQIDEVISRSQSQTETCADDKIGE